MNQKIRDMITERGMFHQEELYEIAEAVIQECIDVCKSRVGNSDYNTGRMHCVSDIKEHFGVE